MKNREIQGTAGAKIQKLPIFEKNVGILLTDIVF